MNKKIKTLIAVGGTGGHVFPGCNLARHLIDRGYSVNLVTDKRGLKYLNKFKDIDFSVIPSSPIVKKNPVLFFISLMKIFFSILISFLYLIFNRPSIIFGMGGYASFPICVAASILRIRLIIYENNLVIGKANKYLLPLAEKILVSCKDLDGVPIKYSKKTYEIGNIIKKEIINFSQIINENIETNKLSILILGGSQAAKVFGEKLPYIFKDLSNENIPLKIYQHCLPSQNETLKDFYIKNNIDFETFNFSDNILDYFAKVNLAITRSGSSMLAELTNGNIPFISVPLPFSADNHQLFNARYYQKKKMAFTIQENDLQKNLQGLIKKIYRDINLLNEITNNQRQHSDKNVYDNIDKILKESFYEKN